MFNFIRNFHAVSQRAGALCNPSGDGHAFFISQVLDTPNPPRYFIRASLCLAFLVARNKDTLLTCFGLGSPRSRLRGGGLSVM